MNGSTRLSRKSEKRFGATKSYVEGSGRENGKVRKDSLTLGGGAAWVERAGTPLT